MRTTREAHLLDISLEYLNSSALLIVIRLSFLPYKEADL